MIEPKIGDYNVLEAARISGFAPSPDFGEGVLTKQIREVATEERLVFDLSRGKRTSLTVSREALLLLKVRDRKSKEVVVSDEEQGPPKRLESVYIGLNLDTAGRLTGFRPIQGFGYLGLSQEVVGVHVGATDPFQEGSVYAVGWHYEQETQTGVLAEGAVLSRMQRRVAEALPLTTDEERKQFAYRLNLPLKFDPFATLRFLIEGSFVDNNGDTRKLDIAQFARQPLLPPVTPRST